MFHYIEGKLALKTDSFAVIETGGMGYRIHSTRPSLEALGEIGSKAKLYTYLNIKTTSDILSLYGFATQEEKNIFEMVLGVSGIGAKTAANLLSNISPSKFALSVVTDDAQYLAKNTPVWDLKAQNVLFLNLRINLRTQTFPKCRLKKYFLPKWMMITRPYRLW